MIRPTTESDSEALADLSAQLGYPASPLEIRERLRILRERGDSEVFVAEIDGSVVGWVNVLGTHVLESPARAEIAGLVVDAAHRSRGLGGELLHAAEQWARSAGYPAVRLRSNVIREEAHRFYIRLGYRITKRQAVFMKDLTPEA